MFPWFWFYWGGAGAGERKSIVVFFLLARDFLLVGVPFGEVWFVGFVLFKVFFRLLLRVGEGGGEGGKGRGRLFDSLFSCDDA